MNSNSMNVDIAKIAMVLIHNHDTCILDCAHVLGILGKVTDFIAGEGMNQPENLMELPPDHPDVTKLMHDSADVLSNTAEKLGAAAEILNKNIGILKRQLEALSRLSVQAAENSEVAALVGNKKPAEA